MTTQPGFIQLFEKQTGILLKQVPFTEIKKKDRWGFLSWKRAYSLDQDNNLIALSIDSIPQSIWNNANWKQLKTLQFLSIKSCTLSDFQFLKDLKQLNSLYLSYNQIQDISFLKDLKQLNSLDLSSNQIHKVPEELFYLNTKISLDAGGGGMNLFENPIKEPPVEILKEGKKAALNWYKQIRKQGTEKLYEARVIIVGEPEAGKTTLFRKLKDENIPVPDHDQKSTHGINISYNREFKNSIEPTMPIKGHIWDFGGQDIQKYLHQYFFSSDNLYILVCDHRSEKTPFDYWFEIISRLCKSSRIIVVQNLKERVTVAQPFNLSEYQERYDNLTITSRDVDFSINDERWTLLIKEIERSLAGLNKINEKVPALWKDIRTEIITLKEKNKKYLSLGEFQELCKNLPKEEDQQLFIKYLHRLGYLLYFDEQGLSNHIFINPNWITEGLYEVLKEDTFKNSTKGYFKKKTLFEKWSNNSYDLEEKNLLLNLMLKDKFDLCYKLNRSDNYLVPLLLPDTKTSPKLKLNEKYVVRYKFPFMPFGFFSQLIVRLSDMALKDNVWLSGVWLEDKNECFALLENYQPGKAGTQIIEANIWGNHRNRLNILSRIRTEMEYIKENLFRNIDIIEQIPCPCDDCQQEKTPYFHNRKHIENIISKGKYESQCKESGDMIPVGKLLNSILDQENLERELLKKYIDMGKEKIHIHLENIGNPQISQDQNTDIDVTQTQKVDIDIKFEIQNFLGETENLKEDILDELEINGLPEKEIKLATRDVEKAEKAIKEIELAQNENREPKPASKTRLSRFINSLGDENSTMHKTLKMLRDGKNYGVQLAEMYNKIAQNIPGMPNVPPLILEVIKKI